MKKFNLFKEIIVADKKLLDEAKNSDKIFGININGDIVYEPFKDDEILIFKNSANPTNDIFGKNYQVVEDGDRVLIKAFSNWQELIGLNTPRASYDDTTADGVAEFSNKELEEIGWHATEFNIDYRTLVELFEEKCDGILLCIEQEDPYQFSGLGFLSDNIHAKEVIYNFCKEKAQNLIKNDPDFALDKLTDDEEEAAEFFGII